LSSGARQGQDFQSSGCKDKGFFLGVRIAPMVTLFLGIVVIVGLLDEEGLVLGYAGEGLDILEGS
jgi:hypothetical protein